MPTHAPARSHSPASGTRGNPPGVRVAVSAYTIPTATLVSDGTLAWHATTLVPAETGGIHGLGYTVADTATARLPASAPPVVHHFAPLLLSRNSS